MSWQERLAGHLEAERGQWLLFVPVVFGLGIALWFILPFTVHRQAAVLAGLSLALGGLALDGLARRIVMLAGLLLAAGLVTADVRSGIVAAPKLYHRLTAAPVVGLVEDVDLRAGGTHASIVLLRDGSSVDPPIRLRIRLSDLPEDVRPGARISVMAVLGPIPGPVLPGAMDPVRKAWFEGISATGRAIEDPVVLERPPPRAAWLSSVRSDLGVFLQDALGGDAGAIAVALVVGEQGQVEPELLDAMRVSGLAHLLTVSGFHIAVVVGGTLFLMRKLLALWPWLALRVSVMRVAAVCAGLAGTGYALLSGAEVPAVRSAITAWIVLIAMMMGRDPLSLRLLAFAAMIILVARPEALLNPSFQLSFAAVTAIVLLSKSAFAERWLKPQPEHGVLIRGARLLLALVATGIVVELVLTPIALAHFGRAGAYGVLANLVAIPLTSFVIMPLLGLFLLLSTIGLGGAVGWALVPALDLLGGLATDVATWPGAKLAVPALPGAAFSLFVGGALLVGLLAGRLRWIGAPLLLVGAGLAIWAPRPDLFISSDGVQVGVVADGRLFTLRAHRGGYLPSMWAERAVAAADGRLSDLPGALCSAAGCSVPVGPIRLLALTGDGARTEALVHACRTADVVTSPGPLPAACAPRWIQLDRAAMRETGAVAITSGSPRLDSVAARAGDHVWSPSALPGERPRLLGGPAWTGVVAE